MNLSNETQENQEAREENKDKAPRQSKKELFVELDKLRKEVNHSRNGLNKIDTDKESWFNKKKELSGTIREKIESIKENKKKRDSLTKNVKELKKKRDAFNQEIRKKISELVKLKDEVKNLTKKSRIKDPHMIKGEIDRIEVKLETEAMPFEKEKEMTKKLKLMKKSIAEASETFIILDKIKKSNLEINSVKKNSNVAHSEIQKLARESQGLHEGIIKNSKEINNLEIKEGEAFKNFLDFKKKFNTINGGLEEKLSQMNKVRGKINKFKLEEDEKRKLEEGMIIKSKEHEIEEKIKTGKKITTDDFLAFQEAIKNKK